MFNNNQNLKSISLRSFTSLTGQCLLFLKKSKIEEISLGLLRYIEDKSLLKSLPYFENLHKIIFFRYQRNGFHVLLSSELGVAEMVT